MRLVIRKKNLSTSFITRNSSVKVILGVNVFIQLQIFNLQHYIGFNIGIIGFLEQGALYSIFGGMLAWYID